MTADRVPQEVLDAAHRKLCRQIGAEIVRRMADTDTSPEMLAVRLQITAKEVWKRIHAFIDGNAEELQWMSDFAFAMGCRWHVDLTDEQKTEMNETP